MDDVALAEGSCEGKLMLLLSKTRCCGCLLECSELRFPIRDVRELQHLSVASLIALSN